MDFLVLNQYGQETYHIKDYKNIYEYYKNLNMLVEDYTNRKTLNFSLACSQLEKTQDYIKKFDIKYSELNLDQIEMFGYEVEKSFELLEKLKIDNLYKDSDEYFIFKYVDFIYNMKTLYNIFDKMLKLVTIYDELNTKIQNPSKVILNKNENLTEQCFHYQQELKDDIKEYFISQLEENPFKEILEKDLSELSMFPNTDFWLNGIYDYLEKINDKGLQFLEFVLQYDYKSNFLDDLKHFSKYDSYDNYTIRILEEKNSNILEVIEYLTQDPNLLWMQDNVYRTLIVPKYYFLNLRHQLAKISLQANIFIKNEFFTMLDVATNYEMVLFNLIMLLSGDILEAQLKKADNETDKAMKNTLDYDLKNLKEEDIEKSGIRVLFAIQFLDLIEGNIQLSDIEDLELFTKVLTDVGLLEKDLIETLYLLKNNLINKKSLIEKIERFITSSIEGLSDMMIISEYYAKKGTLPSKKVSLVRENVRDMMPHSLMLKKLQPPKNKEYKFLTPEAMEKKKPDYSNNKVPKYNKKFLEVTAIKNALYMKNVAEKLEDFSKLLPITNHLKGSEKLALAQKAFSKSKGDFTIDTLKDALKSISNKDENEGLNSLNNIKIENGIAKNTEKDEKEETQIPETPDDGAPWPPDYPDPAPSDPSDDFPKTKKDFFTNIADKISGFTDKLQGYIGKLQGWIQGVLDKYINKFVDKINDFIGNQVNKVNDFLNSVSEFITKIFNKVYEFLNKISDFISSILCALKALLCLIGSILNLGKTLDDTINNIKNELNDFIGSAISSAESLVTSAMGVADSILSTFGIDMYGACNGDNRSFLEQMKDSLEDFALGVVREFMENVKQMFEQSMNCQFAGMNFSLTGFKQFSFSLNPTLPPPNLLRIPNC